MKRIIFAITLGLLTIVPANAQESLDQLLQSVKQSRRQLSAENKQRLEAFGREGDRQRALLLDVVEELTAAEQLGDRLEAQLAASQLELEEMAGALRLQTGDMDALFGVVRQYAGDATGALKSSLASAQFGARTNLLVRLAETGNVPSPEELHEFHVLLLQEMTQSGKVTRFNTEIVNAAGAPVAAEIVRVGMFNLVLDDKFLRYEVNNGTIQELARQPAARYRRDAQTLYSVTTGVTAMAVDPTGGQLLGLLIQTPDALERIAQGGRVGYVIVMLGLLGLLIGVYRVLYLSATGTRISKQLKSDTPNSGNALGRILNVYVANKGVDTETLGLKLDEAIMKETPGLEKWQVALKVIAAVAPLLGLLGTVIGMIETFQQISLFGTGDPRLMADGISKALVTTMLGLLVAIPMVLLHSLVAGRSKHLIEILEEQSAAIIARQAEREL
ncbi:MAG: MotA/TolQ/ExbB proton channel family protein [Gammaproteobacteria bacterium]|nr:MotA/TolQ/ExbB proton channel family protein [Gammaproteobacteria bacterium]MDH3767704.1 MotA/TolQ/ExbB proton channel family protein [Gammaproteobacteria bacterium]